MDQGLHSLYNWFWSEKIWLPKGYTWKDLESNELRKKAVVKELYLVPVLVIILWIVRFFFEDLLARPFCIWLGITEKIKLRPSKFLEDVYKRHTKYPNSKEIAKYVTETGWSKREIKSWFFQRRKNLQNSKMRKATETCWRTLFYLFAFCYGSWVVLRTDWFWDNSKWLFGHIEYHEFTTELKWYYFIEMSFYIALLGTTFVDNKRKDFYQMIVHHIATLILLFGSYIQSCYRFGAVIMFIHDVSDVWLESAKLANYAKLQEICDILFGIFAVVFILTRVIYYPIWVAHGYFYYNNDTNSIIRNIMVILCFLILFLNFYWGYLIGKMAYRVVIIGKVEKDSRSETESEESEYEKESH